MGQEGLAWSSVMLRSHDWGAVMGGRANLRERGGDIVVVSSSWYMSVSSALEKVEGREYCWTRASIMSGEGKLNVAVQFNLALGDGVDEKFRWFDSCRWSF